MSLLFLKTPPLFEFLTNVLARSYRLLLFCLNVFCNKELLNYKNYKIYEFDINTGY